MQQHRESHEHREAYTGKTEKETRPNLLAREPSPPTSMSTTNCYRASLTGEVTL